MTLQQQVVQTLVQMLENHELELTPIHTPVSEYDSVERATDQILKIIDKARLEENQRILDGCDFEAMSTQFKEYNRIALKDAMGHCMICGHDPRLMKKQFENRIAQLSSNKDTASKDKE